MPHTTSYREGFRGNGTRILMNDIRTRGKRAKPDVVRELEAYTEGFMESYRPSLQPGQYLRRIVQRIFFACLPQPCSPSQNNSNAQTNLYIRGNGRKTRDWRIRARSSRQGNQVALGLGRERFSRRRLKPCPSTGLEEIYRCAQGSRGPKGERMQQAIVASVSRRSRKPDEYVRGTARRGSVDRVRLVFLDAVSEETLRDVSWLAMPRRRCPPRPLDLTWRPLS
jgi:hypothetical protein